VPGIGTVPTPGAEYASMFQKEGEEEPWPLARGGIRKDILVFTDEDEEDKEERTV